MWSGDSTIMIHEVDWCVDKEKHANVAVLRFKTKAKRNKQVPADVRKQMIQRYLRGEFGKCTYIEADMNKQIDAYIKRKNIKHTNREYIKHFLFG